MRQRRRIRRGVRRLGRMGGPKASGPGGFCVCPNCKHQIEHTVSQPCSELKCPKCDTLMVRE